MSFSKEEKKIIIELICNEQTQMIVEDSSNYVSDRYKKLEEIKVKIKDLPDEMPDLFGKKEKVDE